MAVSEIYEEIKEVKEVVTRKLVKTVCDRCGAEIPEVTSHVVRELTLEFKVGYSYPDDWGGKVWEVEDLCDDCIGFLKNLLLQNGFKLNEYDY